MIGPISNTTYVHNGVRAAQMKAATSGGATGRAGRGNWVVVGDSNQAITPTNNSAAVNTYHNETGGDWEGIAQWLYANVGCWALGLSNISVNNYNDSNSLAHDMSAAGYTADPAGGSFFNDSFVGNGRWNGQLHYIGASTNLPASLTGAYVSGVHQAAAYEPGNGAWSPRNSPRMNPLYLGDMTTVNVQLMFSYRALGADASVKTCVRLSGGLTDLVASTQTGASGGWQTVTMVVPQNASAAERQAMIYDIGDYYASSGASGFSRGECAWSGFQWTKPGVTASAGPTGWSVTPLYIAGGFSSLQFTNDLWFQPINALGHFFVDCLRAADWCVLDYRMMGNDCGQSYPSFVGGVDSAVNGTLSANPANCTGSGPATNTAAGFSQHLKSAYGYFLNAWIGAGGDRNKFIFKVGGYHPQSGGAYAVQPAMEQAACNLSDTDGYDRMVVVRGSALTTPTEMTSLLWYNGVGQSDTAHKSVLGYGGFNGRDAQRFFEAAIANPSGSSLGIATSLSIGL